MTANNWVGDSVRETRAIGAFLTAPTLAQAAKKACISERTLRRYLARPDFRNAYEDARRRALGAALQRLQDASGVAVRVLLEVAADEAGKPADRLRASNLILDHAVRGAELIEVGERLARLEERIEREGGSLQ